MIYYDKELILNSISNEEICDRLDLKYRYKGNRLEMECPNPQHFDENLGNCISSREGNGCYCFACGESFDKFKMVQLNLNLSFAETLAEMASWAGIEGEEKKETTPQKKFPLTQEEVNLLSLKAEGNSFACIKGNEPWKKDASKKRLRDVNGDVLKNEVYSYSLKKLFFEDEETFLLIIRNKLTEKIKEVNLLIKNSPSLWRESFISLRKELLAINTKIASM